MKKLRGTPSARYIVKNLVVLAGVFSVFVLLVKANTGYDLLFNKLLQERAAQQQYEDLSYDDRREIKLGYNFTYLQLLRSRTPETAVILMPPDSVFRKPDGEHAFIDYWITNRGWASYFVYPRRLVYSDDLGAGSSHLRPTHVAIVHYWGYDKLAYPVDKKYPYDVMPF
ncbi:hypothetical protein [Parachryseolinea silvisoli]|uniref:hypothetical protein n=1 Tax=Parachryseolinea silvisoli TaxID=2873601 RepID=UPI002265E289|nr:hypothetical protein [Parachryseolinea silvisoli]MCD9018643.1 hypothetical protein [Parachryseolinea silvisoli]